MEDITYMLKDEKNQEKNKRRDDLDKLERLLDTLYQFIGPRDYQVLLTSYGIFDHDKFSNNEKFDNFMDFKGQRIDFYTTLEPELQAEFFDVENKSKYYNLRSSIKNKLRNGNVSESIQ